MKKITSSLIVIVLLLTVTFSSCSKDDEPQETLTVTATIEGVSIDQTFTVDAKDVHTDDEGFEFNLTWNDDIVDVDLEADYFTETANFQTGLARYSSDGVSNIETIKVYNSSENTFGKTVIFAYNNNGFEGNLNYTLIIKRISNGDIIKTKTGVFQVTSDEISFANIENHGFINIGDFVKTGNKFYWSY